MWARPVLALVKKFLFYCALSSYVPVCLYLALGWKLHSGQVNSVKTV